MNKVKGKCYKVKGNCGFESEDLRHLRLKDTKNSLPWHILSLDL
jgi:hypothetical protein